MAVRPQLQPHFATFIDGLVSFAINHDDSLAVDFDLILDALADEQSRLSGAANHARGNLGAERRVDLHVFRSNADVNRFAVFHAPWIVAVSKDDAVPCSGKSDRHLAGRIARLHLPFEEKRSAHEVAHEFVDGFFVKQTWVALLLDDSEIHQRDAIR